MSVNLSINFDQLKTLVGQCDINQKLELIRSLEKETYPIRFRRLLDKMKIEDITMDEITSEVEFVRAQRYNDRKKV